MTAKIEKIRRMQHIWETQVKPFVEDSIEKEDGQYAAMVLVAHACEHAYKAIHNPKERNVMQESLESVLRLRDSVRVYSSGRSVTTEATKHWGKTDAHKLRAIIVNPWKHEGILKGEETELVNTPDGFVSGYSGSRSGLKITFNAYYFVLKLVSGIDAAYALFLDDPSPLQQKEWFSPALCSRGRRCKKCKKELRPCERCEEELDKVGATITCMCDENSESIREAIRWIRRCETHCTDPRYPKCRDDDHFLLSDECLFSSVCREINSVLIANLPEPVPRDGAIWYASGTYTEDEMKTIMRPLREEVDKCLTKLERKHAQ